MEGRNRYLCILLACFWGDINAQERELATHGESIRFTMDSDYKCGDTATINITTEKADSFELDDQAIQTWSDAIRDILGFECSGSIVTLYFKGLTDGVEVFSADTNAQVDWLIQSEPAPLERLALFFSLKKPDLFNFGALYALHKPLEAVPGIKGTFQYSVFKQEMLRLSEAVDGDIDSFQTYLKSAGPGLPNFEAAKHHHDTLMEAIQAFKPEHYESYLLTYLSNLQQLKQDYWTAKSSKILDDYSLSLGQVFIRAKESTDNEGSDEFTTYMDKELAQVANDEFSVLQDELEEGTLLEVSYAADFLAELPEPATIEPFPDSAALFETYPDQILGIINTRLDQLSDIARQTIDISGDGHLDTNAVIETGFALASEYEESGFNEEAEQLVTATIDKVNSLLESDLSSFADSISELVLTDKIATDLQSQSHIYQELASQFSGFTNYQKIVDRKLVNDRDQICASLLANASVDTIVSNQNVRIFDDEFSISSIACDLYDNDHMLVGFSNEKDENIWNLLILKEDENEASFTLIPDEADSSVLIPDSIMLAENETNEPEIVKEELLKLVQPPPNGNPDANGIRECDRLAGDPEDPNKLVSGTDFNAEDVDPREFDRALDACVAAVENDPAQPRLQYQLGRMLWLAGDEEVASEYFDLAANQNYGAALHYKAEVLLSASENQNDFVDALNWFEQAGKAGYQPANAMVKELNPDGTEFYKEIPGPTESDMDSVFNKRKCINGGLLFTTCAKQRGARIKNCMQTSAIHFECEYRINVRCEGGSNMFQNMAAAACRNAVVDWHFGRFKKESKGWSFEKSVF